MSRSLNAYEQIELGDSVIIPGDDPMTALVANTTLKELRDRLSEFDDVLAEAAAKRKR